MSVTDAAHFPAPAYPEVAFLGRSNVGKSSVINSLLGSKVAKTSSTPGRTRSINFFEVRWPGRPHPELVFADLPGYGYAKISKEIREQWPSFIEPYLRSRRSLALCVSLIDVSIPSQESDRQLLQFLHSVERPVLVVATKSDRVSGNQLRNALHALESESPGVRILPYSSKSGEGRAALWEEIRRSLQGIDISRS